MRKTREILRLRATTDLSDRQIARSCRVSPTSVGKILRAAEAAQLGWPLPAELSDSALSDRLFPAGGDDRPARPLPDMTEVAEALRVKGVTLQLLWEEYRRDCPDGYGYTQFCEYFRRWRKASAPAMRFEHKAGERMFVDWAGPTLAYVDPKSGATQKGYVFVAVLACSNYTFAEVFPNMSLHSWITAHIRAFEYFGGVAGLVVPDNTKTAVTRPDYYDPDVNPTYQELAEHYGAAVLPARVARPRDKGKGENAVQNAERRIMAPLRNVRLLGLSAARHAVRNQLTSLNDRPFSKMDGSRREAFEEMERTALKPLPAAAFAFGSWQQAKVYIDYHIQADWHYYSVPYEFVGKQVDVRMTGSTVEVFLDGRRIAAHKRSYHRGKATTLPEHRAQAHRFMIERDAELFVRRAESVGSHCVEAVTCIRDSYPHPEMAFRGMQGLLRLAGHYGKERLEQACKRAIKHNVCRYKTIQQMLENNRENVDTPEHPAPIKHANIRGGDYYRRTADQHRRAAGC